MSTRRSLSTYLLTAVLSIAWLAQGAHADAIKWYNDLDSAKVEAARTGKLVLLHFWTKSCGPCKKLERDVFSQPQIGNAMHNDFVPVKIDADLAPALANAYQINRVPSEVVITAQGSVVTKLSCPLDPTAYGTQLANVAQNYRRPVGSSPYSTQATVNSAYAGLKIGQVQSQPVAPTATQTAASQPKAAGPSSPNVMQNPYVTASQPAAPKPAPTQTAAPAQPALPANAMPNSYRDRYAAAAPVKPVKQEVPVAPPVAAAPPTITPTATAQKQVAAPTQQAVAAAAAVAQPQPAWPPQLPPNTPPLAFDGYCPVSLKDAKKWVQGNQQFGAIHRGRTYLFTGEQQRQQFLADPDAFSPVFAGKDPVVLLDENKSVEGSRKYGFEYRGAFYLFSSKASMTRFESQPDRYAAGVRQAMGRMDASAGGTLRR